MKYGFLREALRLLLVLTLLLPAVNAALEAETRKEVALRQIFTMVEGCRALNTDFAARSETAYAAWRKQHSEFLAALGKRPAYPEELAQLTKDLQGGAAQLYCTDDLISHLELSSRPVDTAFASPEATWATFITALRQADRTTAIGCLYGTAEANWKNRLQQLSDDDLRRMGNAVKELKMDWGDEQMKMGFIVRHDGKAGSVAFVNVYGHWKIMEM